LALQDRRCHVVKRGGRRWKKGGREEGRLGDDLGDLGGRRELEVMYLHNCGEILQISSDGLMRQGKSNY